MARNGSGTYARVAGTPYVYNTIIDQVVVNAEMDDIATALTNSIAKNGETTPTANLPMGTYKLTGLGAGTGAGDSVRYEQVALLTGNNTFSGTNIHTGAETFKGTSDATKIISISPDTSCATGTTNKADAFPSGTKMVFAQAAAPAGWTQDASNDQVLRVVSGAGGGSGGTLSITSAAVGDHTLTDAEIPSHNHTITITDPGHSHAMSTGDGTSSTGTYTQRANSSYPGGASTQSATTGITASSSNLGGGGAHAHPLAIKYQDVIICSKN